MKLLSLLLTTTITFFPGPPGKLGFLWNPSTHVILKVFPGSPAALQGLRKGDKVLYPPGKDLDGSEGSHVTLVIKRGNDIGYYDLERVNPRRYKR